MRGISIVRIFKGLVFPVLVGLLVIPLPSYSAGTMIQEERPKRVWGIDFEGNETYSGLVLGNIIALEAPSLFRKLRFWNRSGFDFYETELRRDEIRIERFYQRRGFPDVSVSAVVEEGRRDWVRRIVFHIDEGPPITIRNVRHEIEADPDTKEYLKEQRDYERALRRHEMQEGRRYQLIEHSDVEGRFLSVLRDLGFAHADVHVSSAIDTTGRYADVVVTMVPGSLTTFGEIQVEGNETVPASIVVRHSELRTGDLYSSRKLRNAQRQVFNHHLFRFVTVSTRSPFPSPSVSQSQSSTETGTQTQSQSSSPYESESQDQAHASSAAGPETLTTHPAQLRDTTVVVNIRVREHAPRSIRVQGGAGIEEIVRTSLTWEHRNPFGNAHNFSVSGRASLLEQRFNMDYYIPYVFNPKSWINISPFGQRLDERGYLLLRGGINNSFIYQINSETAGTISYEFTRNREQLHSPDEIIPEEDQYYNISALKLSGYHNQLELERYQGWVIRPYAEFSGFLGTGSLRYNRYVLDIRRYIDVSPTTQLAIRNEGGLLTFTGLDHLPSNVRFYTGGTSTVRGWQRRQLGPKRAVVDEDGRFLEYVPVGGKAMYFFNLEVRQQLDRLIRRFGAAMFLDGGGVWEDTDEIHTNDLQFGLGFGLRYESPIGPIRIDLARKLNPTDEDLNIYNGRDYGRRFDRWGVHFSIGQAF